MLVRNAIQARLAEPEIAGERSVRGRLPTSLKSDRTGVRTAMLRRLATSRLFAIGDRAGVLRSAQKRSGRSFRLDVRQRVVVKALVSRHVGNGEALAKHVAYLGRSGAGLEGVRARFFDRAQDEVDAAAVTAAWHADRHHFRFIISPEHGDRIGDLRAYAREVMRRVAEDLGQPELEWLGACHFDTDQPHAHVLARGKRASGKDLVIPRDYIGYGFRARAQEVAHELLGDLSRADAERRIWRETEADRFTGFDRRLLAAADEDRLVNDGVGGGDAWAALTRGRLRHLEAIGLATREGARYRLDADLEMRLRGLQLRNDVIRTLHQRRLQSGESVQELGAVPVRGRVVARGAHDELGATPWVIVRDSEGAEHYARLALAQTAPALGRSVDLIPGARGAQVLEARRGRGAGRDV
jgi:type IV secretory pathway VirD2 relaxase